jgi:hypothetical protein
MAMEENKVIQNKIEEDNWVRPEYKPMPEYNPDDGYKPMPEYNPDDFKPVEFDECFKPLIEHFKRRQSEPTPKFNTTEGSMSMFQISHGGI